MKNIITILFLLLVVLIQAQVPGYLGKRFSVEANIDILPRLNNIILDQEHRTKFEYISKDFENEGSSYTANYYSPTIKRIENYKGLKLNLKAELNINYVISRNIESSIRITYIKNSMVFNTNTSSSGSISYNNRKNSFYFSTKEDEIKYKVFQYDLNFRFYKNKYIAPVGVYFMAGLGFSQASTVGNGFEVEYVLISKKELYPGSKIYLPDTTSSLMVKNKVSYMKLNFGVGNKYVGKNNIYFSYEVETVLSDFFIKYRRNKLNQEDDSTPQKKFDNVLLKKQFNKHTSFQSFLNLKIGIGIII